MNHRREGDGRQKRKRDDPEYGLGTDGNDLFRFTRRGVEHPLNGPSNSMTEPPVDSGPRTDSGKATVTVVITVPDAGQTLEWWYIKYLS